MQDKGTEEAGTIANMNHRVTLASVARVSPTPQMPLPPKPTLDTVFLLDAHVKDSWKTCMVVTLGSGMIVSVILEAPLEKLKCNISEIANAGEKTVIGWGEGKTVSSIQDTLKVKGIQGLRSLYMEHRIYVRCIQV